MSTEKVEQDTDYTVYSYGLCYASVCSSLPTGEIAARLNVSHPTGVSSLWGLSTDKKFASGEPNPCPCPDYPQNRHYLFSC
jgi:hypothetical protein